MSEVWKPRKERDSLRVLNPNKFVFRAAKLLWKTKASNFRWEKVCEGGQFRRGKNFFLAHPSRNNSLNSLSDNSPIHVSPLATVWLESSFLKI
jgi:hypothetical protein